MPGILTTYNLAGFECVQDSVLDNKPQSLPAATFVQRQESAQVCIISTRTHLQTINQSINCKITTNLASTISLTSKSEALHGNDCVS